MLVPAAAVFGLFLLIFGDSVPYRNAERQNFTFAGWLLMLAVAGCAANPSPPPRAGGASI